MVTVLTVSTSSFCGPWPCLNCSLGGLEAPGGNAPGRRPQPMRELVDSFPSFLALWVEQFWSVSNRTPQVAHDDNLSTHIQLIAFLLFPVSLPIPLLQFPVTSQINDLHQILFLGTALENRTKDTGDWHECRSQTSKAALSLAPDLKSQQSEDY